MGSGDESSETFPLEDAFFEQGDLLFMNAVSSTFICSELHILQIQYFTFLENSRGQ